MKSQLRNCLLLQQNLTVSQVTEFIFGWNLELTWEMWIAEKRIAQWKKRWIYVSRTFTQSSNITEDFDKNLKMKIPDKKIRRFDDSMSSLSTSV